MLEQVRKELCEFIEKYGLSDERTIKKSQELDLIIVKYVLSVSSELH